MRESNSRLMITNQLHDLHANGAELLITRLFPSLLFSFQPYESIGVSYQHGSAQVADLAYALSFEGAPERFSIGPPVLTRREV